MTRYRKKPVEIEAMKLTRENRDEVAAWCHGVDELKTLPGPGRGAHEGVVIHTLEGDMRADLGDWIVRGVQGEFYPVKTDIFAATYEEAQS
ncbi:MAG: hypothetical protein ACRDQA_30695 [Nocardioidaceae bacterium]